MFNRNAQVGVLSLAIGVLVTVVSSPAAADSCMSPVQYRRALNQFQQEVNGIGPAPSRITSPEATEINASALRIEQMVSILIRQAELDSQERVRLSAGRVREIRRQLVRLRNRYSVSVSSLLRSVDRISQNVSCAEARLQVEDCISTEATGLLVQRDLLGQGDDSLSAVLERAAEDTGSETQAVAEARQAASARCASAVSRAPGRDREPGVLAERDGAAITNRLLNEFAQAIGSPSAPAAAAVEAAPAYRPSGLLEERNGATHFHQTMEGFGAR